MVGAPTRQQYRDEYLADLKARMGAEKISSSGKIDRAVFINFMKRAQDRAREEIKQIHLSGAGGAEVVHRITAWTDTVLVTLFETACRLSGVGKDMPCALLAIGGYGRGELNPYSDLDVMFLTRKEIDSASRNLSETCLYLMWDLNLDVGHGIRTISDCVDLAASDIKAKTSLIESRFLAGDRKIYEEFTAVARTKILHRDTATYLRIKIGDVHDRYKKFGGSLYMKEPHVKEGMGGLRDIHTALWIAKVKFGVESLAQLEEKGVITSKEKEILRHSKEFLWKVRNHLHYLSGRRNDLLTMELQEKVAAFLRYRDFKHTLAVERCMRGYYLQTRNVHYFTSLLINRCSPPLRRNWFRGRPFRKKEVGTGFMILGNTLCVPDRREGFFREDPARLMEIFVLSQRYHVPIADVSRQRIVSSLGLVNDDFRSSGRVTDFFLRILGSEKGVVSILREMHELRFLGKYLPEFGALTALVQHELYHTYTVDEHTLMALEQLERLRGSPYPDEKFYSEIFSEVRKPEILFLSLLLHDIGKAMGHGHVHRGGKAVPAIMHRLGLPREDAQTVEFLVRNHLVMGHLSQRRDLHDLRLIAQFGRAVQEPDRLRMLTLLTYCDSRGVGPDLWNAWKDSLLKEIFFKAYNHLVADQERSTAEIRDAYLEKIRKRVRTEGAELFGEAETDRLLKSLSSQYLLRTPQSLVMKHLGMIRRAEKEGFVVTWENSPSKGYTELNVCTYDSDTPGLFSRIAGILASKGINILGARIYTSQEGVVIDCIHVSPPDETMREDPSYWKEIEETIRSVVQRTQRVEEVLVEHQPPSYLSKKRGRRTPPRVQFDNEISKKYTVIDVYAEDRLGLLYRITATLAALGIQIHSAKVTTEMNRAIDAFYVTDIFGDQITDPQKLEKIQERLLTELQAEHGDKLHEGFGS
jgi:[protein-PII] uridylyltransferase